MHGIRSGIWIEGRRSTYGVTFVFIPEGSIVKSSPSNVVLTAWVRAGGSDCFYSCIRHFDFITYEGNFCFNALNLLSMA